MREAGALSVNVKKEISSPARPCSFEEALKAMKTTGCNVDKVTILPNALITPLISSSMIKTEDVTPMEVTSEKRSSPIFQTTKTVGSTQQTLETISNIAGNASFSSPSSSHLSPENENQQQLQPKAYNPETLTTIQTQDISQPGTFPAVSASSQLPSSDALLQQATQFQTREAQSRDTIQSDSVVNLSQLTEASQQQQSPLQEQAQTLQQQIPSNIFPSPNSVSQLQSTIQQLQAGSFTGSTAGGSNGSVDLVQQVLEAQQQLSSVLFSTPDGNENVPGLTLF